MQCVEFSGHQVTTVLHRHCCSQGDLHRWGSRSLYLLSLSVDDGGYFLTVLVCCPPCITALPWMFEFYPFIAAVETLLCRLMGAVVVILCELCEVTSAPSIASNGNCSRGTVFVCGSDGVWTVDPEKDRKCTYLFTTLCWGYSFGAGLCCPSCPQNYYHTIIKIHLIYSNVFIYTLPNACHHVQEQEVGDSNWLVTKCWLFL